MSSDGGAASTSGSGNATANAAKDDARSLLLASFSTIKPFTTSAAVVSSSDSAVISPIISSIYTPAAAPSATPAAAVASTLNLPAAINEFSSLPSSRRSRGMSESFGWFENDDEEQDSENNKQERDGWMNLVAGSASKKKLGIGTGEGMITSTPLSRIKEEKTVLFEWRNPNPSVSYKLSTSDNNGKGGYGMHISSSVNMVRIVQNEKSGDVFAEFLVNCYYGSKNYGKWKPYSEFKHFADTICYIHDNGNPMFPLTLRAWNVLQSKKRWFRSLDVLYLIEKSVYLSRFIEFFLHESPSPGLLLCFIENRFDSL